MIRPNLLCTFADDIKLGETVHTLEARAAIQRPAGWRNGLTENLRSSTKANASGIPNVSPESGTE